MQQNVKLVIVTILEKNLVSFAHVLKAIEMMVQIILSASLACIIANLAYLWMSAKLALQANTENTTQILSYAIVWMVIMILEWLQSNNCVRHAIILAKLVIFV